MDGGGVRGFCAFDFAGLHVVLGPGLVGDLDAGRFVEDEEDLGFLAGVAGVELAAGGGEDGDAEVE